MFIGFRQSVPRIFAAGYRGRHLAIQETDIQSEAPSAILISMKFEWNENKAVANLSKHGVSFDEAKTVFDDPLYVDFYDPDHSYNEDRHIIIGQSQQGRLLIVSYTERENVIRLISARKLTQEEREAYEEG